MSYLSIIIPVYNAEIYLKDCIDSILNQCFTDFEVILVDDGSTDASGIICDDYTMKDSRIKTIHLKNGGPSRARNRALAIANGKYIEFVDSDDRIEPDALMEIYTIFKNQNEEVLITNTNVVDGKDNVIQFLELPHYGKKSTDDILKNFTPSSKAIHLHYLWNKWYNLEFLRKNNIQFNEKVRLGEDFLFNCDVYSATKIVYGLDILLYHYYKRDNGSLSSTYNSKELERRRMMDNALIELYRNRQLYNSDIRDRIDKMIGAMALASVRSVLGKNSPDKNIQKAYIDEFLKSEYYDYLVKYAHSDDVVIANRIELKLLEMGWVQAFLLVEKARKRL